MFDRTIGKVLPVILPLVLIDSDAGTGNFGGNNCRCVFGRELVDTGSTQLDKETGHDHGFLVHATSSCKPDSGPDKSS